MTMDQFFIEHEATFRLTAFLSALIIFGFLEYKYPARKLTQKKSYRWIQHLILLILNSVIIRYAVPMVAVGASIYASNQQWGLFNLIELPLFVSIILSIIILDCLIYWQHRLFHVFDFLWVIHKVHHADLDVDVTTALRFHPLEMLLSILIKLVAIILLGAPIIAVVIFEILLNVLAMFNHSNIRLPTRLDRILRSTIVTRNVHEIHHSTNLKDSQMNFGFNLIWWDKLFGSYKSKAEYQNFVIGLKEQQNTQNTQPILSILTLPFKKKS
ncbi:MAG: sterol desaturase family protein [Pseudomonadales bacterium]|nr:sterol desaturase family protein [Pseudomonadales bacterium]